MLDHQLDIILFIQNQLKSKFLYRVNISNEYQPFKSVIIPEDSKCDYSDIRSSFNSIQLNDNPRSVSQLSVTSDKKTERIMKKIKYQRYKEIFSMLLPDIKGLISKETIYKNNLSSGLRKIISPLLDELEELNETLDFNEFYDAMEMLMKSLTPGDKSIILLPTKAKTVPDIEYNFKPKTNAEQNSVSNFTLYERGIQKKQEISRKIEKERKNNLESEMKECKFTPNLMNNQKKIKNNISL